MFHNYICFALHDKTERYSKFTGTAMLSVFENTDSEIMVHILHDNTLTNDNRDKFISLVEQYNQLVKFSERRKLKISAIVSGKTRAFFIAPEEIESTKKLFSIRAREIIIPAENEDSIQKLIDAMKLSKGKSVFFIMTENFLDNVFPFDLLIKQGFVERIDFIKGWKYLDSLLDSYLLICTM